MPEGGDRIRRRRSWPVRVRAQLWSFLPSPDSATTVDEREAAAFQQGLADVGYVEDRNLSIDRPSDGRYEPPLLSGSSSIRRIRMPLSARIWLTFAGRTQRQTRRRPACSKRKAPDSSGASRLPSAGG